MMSGAVTSTRIVVRGATTAITRRTTLRKAFLAPWHAMLEQIDGLRVYKYIPDDISPPAAVIMPPVIPDYWGDIGGATDMDRFPVLLLVAANIDRHALSLYDLIDKTGPKSVFAIINADRELGGLDVDARASGVEDFDTERFGLIRYFGRVVNVDVIR